MMKGCAAPQDPERSRESDDIKELYSLRPDRFKFDLNTVNGRIERYIYENQGRKVSWDVDFLTGQSDILHLKNFNPLDDWW